MHPPCLADKLIDWQLLAMQGQGIFTDRDVIEFGPSFGIDLLMFGPSTRSYVVVESDPSVLAHLRKLEAVMENVSVLQANLRYSLLGVADASFDVVLDFGTIDNVGSDVPYQEAYRILRKGGLLLSTYANLRCFNGARTSPSGDEVRRDPWELREFLVGMGMQVLGTIGETQIRAGIIARKR